MKLQVTRMAQHTTDDAHFRLAFRLVASDKEQDVLRTYHLMDEVIGWIEGIGDSGWAVSDALEQYQHFDTLSVEDAIQVEETLKNDCKDLAAKMTRLPSLAAKFDGDDEYEF